MLNIKQKSDILIPFRKIGDDGWVENTQLIITSLADNWSEDLAAPISISDILELEHKLITTLPNSLKLFYQHFGIAEIGEDLQSFQEIDWIKDLWSNTAHYTPDFSEDDMEKLPFLISFSDYLGNGNMFCFHSETKEIYYYDHDKKPYISKLFEDASDYIKACLIACQVDLFNVELDQKQVELWSEEVLDDLFGKHIVTKWRY